MIKSADLTFSTGFPDIYRSPELCILQKTPERSSLSCQSDITSPSGVFLFSVVQTSDLLSFDVFLLPLFEPDRLSLRRRVDQLFCLIKRRGQILFRPFLSGLFLSLDLIPFCQHLTGIGDHCISEHMGMPADHLVNDGLDHIIHGEIAFLLRNPGI